jgi:hypothetical protein
VARDARRGGDELSPLAAIERGSGGIDFDASIVLAVSRRIAAVNDFDRRRRGDNAFKAAQQALGTR